MSNGAANCSSCIRRRDRCRPLACIQRRGQPRMVLPTPYCHSERSEKSSAPCPRPRGSEKQTLRVAQGDRANHCGKIISHGGVRIPSPSSLHFRKICHSRHQSSGIQVFSSSSSGLHFKLEYCTHSGKGVYVLIPSSSGLHFKRWTTGCIQRCGIVLIPSSSGLHFKLLKWCKDIKVLGS